MTTVSARNGTFVVGVQAFRVALQEAIVSAMIVPARHEEARRLSEGSDSCWSDSGSDSGSEAVLETGIEPLALGGWCSGGHTRSWSGRGR